MKNVLLGCTGSVASIKIPEILEKLKENSEISVKLVVTEHSQHFLPPLESLGVDYLTDTHEWDCWKSRGDPVLHIELRKWADICIVAPLDANTLAKVANGQADNLLTCVLRAWDFTKPIVVAPAMNTYMFEHPVTRPQLQTIQGWGYTVLEPQVKTLVCGDKGTGAMASVETILESINSVLV
ncbi:phosphopantothenoylcysteine decarboxylase [Eurytemora carolleeae]|uniref:phosphopantothenoylcysteine decarboxylase n=1 Tax=Eurytemora carolleeae TaxID=1294199 RepID=UPI000C75872F|nr:phosphopantothenoylcysteine decarboxylase [Eurytemora carolleeae]XP_023320355.1 phosphopantothenoylcysteine decarboxylase [Eurytemora carolleeae]|eukprot:XP_023320354.1 phosphopantothenoylcysteine decarboxylase-like [Eurytemora affinis]